MAIYHFSAKMISRSTGRSAVAAAAYRTAERLEDERQGLAHDYSNRSGVLHCEILAPEGVPEDLRDRSRLWNAVEAAEKRKDAQLAREVTLALPHELDDAQRAALVRSFAQSAFVDRGMIADVALHAPGREGDQRNHHAHILLTTRSVGPEGFEGKERSWNSKAVLEGWRESWADHVNGHLREIEDAREIDHRSLEAQREDKLDQRDAALARGDEMEAQAREIEAVALDRDPLPDIGWQAWGMERRGVRTAAGDLWRAAQGRLEDVRDLVSGLAERFIEIYGRGRGAQDQDRDVARASGLAVDLGGRLRAAWAARGREGPELDQRAEAAAEGPSDGLASRLRAAMSGRSRDELSAQMAGYRAAVESEAAQERADGCEQTREQERTAERKREGSRERGPSHGM